MAEPSFQIGDHVRVATRMMPGALRPASVTPYCSQCNVAWPCPPVAHQLEASESDDQR